MPSEANRSSSIEQALSNLEQIKGGGDPRVDPHPSADEQTFEVLPESELRYRHDEIRRDRDQIVSDFIEAVNIVEPDHPKMTNDRYPITRDDVELSYCKESSSTWARCGPRWINNVVYFAPDRKTMGRMDRERYHNVLVHELTHIEEGSHTPGSTHNPRFWRSMADNAVQFACEWDGPLDLSKFISYCRHEPNRPMTDRRMMTVAEQQQAVEDRMRTALE